MSPALQRRLSWLAVFAGIAVAIALALWLAAEQRRAAQSDRDAGWISEAVGFDQRGAPPKPRLVVPAINVSAHAVNLGLNSDGTLEVPKDYTTVGLWKNGPAPGSVMKLQAGGSLSGFAGKSLGSAERSSMRTER